MSQIIMLSIKTSSNRTGLHLVNYLPKRSHGQFQLSLDIPETFLSLHNLGTRPCWSKHKLIMISNIKELSCCQLEGLPLLTRICSSNASMLPEMRSNHQYHPAMNLSTCNRNLPAMLTHAIVMKISQGDYFWLDVRPTPWDWIHTRHG